MIQYKIDILKELKNRGYSTAEIRRKKLISEATLQNIRKGKSVSLDTLNTICIILRCTPNDIIEVTPTDEEKIKFF